MGLRSIHFTKTDEEWKKKLNKVVTTFETAVQELGLEFATSKKTDKDFSTSLLRRDTNEILHTIFNPAFVKDVIFNLDTEPAKVLKIEDLQPYRCNYPSEMTLRTKNLHGCGKAPCKRKLGKNNVYFCSIPVHLAYAKSLKLPITKDDLEEKNLPVPNRPTCGSYPVKHVRF